MSGKRFFALGLIAGLVGCAQSSTLTPTLPSSAAQAQPSSTGPTSGTTRASQMLSTLANPRASKIQHVVIIIQENRTTNDLFNGLPGADTVRIARNSLGELVHLRPRPLTAPYDISHRHSAFETEYSKGFDQVASSCNSGRDLPGARHPRVRLCAQA